jgi:hypothetical protein
LGIIPPPPILQNSSFLPLLPTVQKASFLLLFFILRRIYLSSSSSHCKEILLPPFLRLYTELLVPLSFTIVQNSFFLPLTAVYRRIPPSSPPPPLSYHCTDFKILPITTEENFFFLPLCLPLLPLYRIPSSSLSTSPVKPVQIYIFLLLCFPLLPPYINPSFSPSNHCTEFLFPPPLTTNYKKFLLLPL